MAVVIDATTSSSIYATRLLVESGHRVIRIESPAGDAVRRLGPFLKDRADLEHGAFHQFMNAGKESFSLDVRSAVGEKLYLELLERADLLVATRPLPLDIARIFAANPRIAVVEVDDVPNEICAYARSGLMCLTGHPGKPPLLVGGHAAFSAIGVYVSVAASACLFAAKASGTGQRVEVSAAACLEALGEQSVQIFHTTGKVTARRGYRGSHTAISGAFPCADGYWMISTQAGPGAWGRLLDWVNDPVLAADPTVADEDGRESKRDFILDRLSEWSKQYTKAELVEQAQKRHIPASPVATTDDLARDPQLIARGFFRELDHPDLGTISVPVGAIGRGKAAGPRPAPHLGQHTTALLEELGHGRPVQRALVERGIV